VLKCYQLWDRVSFAVTPAVVHMQTATLPPFNQNQLFEAVLYPPSPPPPTQGSGGLQGV